MKRLADTLWRHVGMLPPTLKTKFIFRVLSALNRRRAPSTESSFTNLGLASMPRLEFRSHVPDAYLFGRADQYLGERGPLFLARHLSSHSDAFVDIGAHQGYFTFFVRETLSKQIPIYFIEPEPSLFSQITENVAKNGLENVSGLSVGIGEKTGKVSFFVAEGSQESTLKPEHATKYKFRETQIDLMTFADLARAKSFGQACVKVDVENAEMDFLKGAVAEGRRMRFLICEVLAPAVEKGFITKATLELGMSAYYINDFRLEPCVDGAFTYVPPDHNFLFCRETPAELARLLAGTRFVVAEPARPLGQAAA